jgi:hypothetical protein
MSIWCFNHLLTTITQGISMVVVLVRVETGVSYDHNSGRSESIQHTPFALKFNRDTNKVGRSDSSNDAHSGSSYARVDAGTLPDVVLQNLNYSSVNTTGASSYLSI